MTTKIEIQNWDLVDYREAIEKYYWILHNSKPPKDDIETLKWLAKINGLISLRQIKYRLQLSSHYGKSAHDFLGERMATVEINDDNVDQIIGALDKAALCVGLIDNKDRTAVDRLRQLRNKIEEAKSA